MKKVIQNDLYDCGICSLKAILNYYGGDVPLDVLRHDTFTDCGGTDMYHLLEAGKKYGLDGYGKKVDIDDLSHVTLPLICHTIINQKYEHFMVIEKVSDKHIYVMDPAKGNVKYNKLDFQKIFTNVVLILYPKTKLINIIPKKPLHKEMFSILLKEKKLLKNLIVCTVITSLLAVSYSFFFKYFYSSLILKNNNLLKVSLIFSFILLFLTIFLYLRDYYNNYLAKNVDAYIKDYFIKHIFYLPSYSIKSRSPGEILTRVNELNNYRTLLTDCTVNLLLDSIAIIITGIFLLIINYRLLIVLLITLFLYLLIGLITKKTINKKIDYVLTKETEYNNNLVENINNLDSLKYLHLEESNYLINQKLNVDMLYENFMFENYLNKINFIKNIIHEFGLLIINIIGVYLISINKFTFIDLITFNTLMIYFKEPIKNYIDLIPKYTFVKSSYSKLDEFLNISEENFMNKPRLLDNGDIIYKNVGITYDGIKEVISNVNFRINKNSKVMISGRSGIGKSSLIKLLLRLNDNYSGNIAINNINIKDLDLNVIRSNIGYLGQKEGLFSDTIYNNIVMNRVVSNEEFHRICKICEIEEILENKPLRYNTVLFEGGKNISGGEKQRILLARILLKYPEILILDEALSELNINLELKILNNLKKYLKNRTLIYITHRNINYLFDQVIEIS